MNLKDHNSNELGLINGPLIDPENEFEPTNVDLGAIPIAKKGFKRIDNGEIFKPDQTISTPVIDPKEEPLATVYRDLSGKIIDLKAKREELKSQKEEDAEREALEKERVNTGELDQIRRNEETEKLQKATRFDYSKTDKEYKDHMTNKEMFEDPLAGRLSTSGAFENPISATGRPVFSGGQHPVNRFKIKAGHFWDGIDRGNGFEDRLVRARDLIYVKKVTDRGAQESYTDYDFE